MKKSIDSMQGNLNSIRTGRASPSLLDRVTVMYYDCETPLSQLAGISVSGGQVWIHCIHDLPRGWKQNKTRTNATFL